MKQLIILTSITVCLASTVQAQVAVEGVLAAKVTNTTPGAFAGDTGFDVGNNLVPVSGGTTVTASFWARSANVIPSAFFRAGLAFFEGQNPDGNGNGFLGDFNIVGPGTPLGAIIPLEWRLYSASIPVPPTANFVGIAIRVDGGGVPSHSIVIDQVRLANDATAPPTILALSNPGFENWPDPATAPPVDWRHFAVAGASGNVMREENPPVATSATEMLTPIFKRDANALTNDWFATDANTRGMAFNPLTNHLLVVDRESGTVGNIRVLDATTGLDIDLLTTSGIESSNSTFVINKIGVDAAGRIFVSNLAIANNGGILKVYMYASEAAAIAAGPTLVYSGAPIPGVRLGDDMDVTGSGANTRIVISGRGPDRILALTDPENDGTFAGIDYSVPGLNGASNVSFMPDPDQFAWHRSLGFFNSVQIPDYPNVSLPVSRVKFLDGTPTGAPPYRLNTPHSTGPFDISAHPARGTLLVVAPAEAEYTTATTNVAAYGYDFNDPLDIPFKTGGLEKAGGYFPNGNGTGDVIIDPVGNRIFFLVTSNSISAWNLPLASRVDEWMLF